jgi:hypothetical protein
MLKMLEEEGGEGGRLQVKYTYIYNHHHLADFPLHNLCELLIA